MWCAHWGEDAHVYALLDAGADDSTRTTAPWFNMAMEYESGLTALDIATLNAEEYDNGPASRRIVRMLESAAIGEWEGYRQHAESGGGSDSDCDSG